MFIFALIEFKFIGKNYKNFWRAKLGGTVMGLILVPTIYYTYTGVFGVNVDWFNILIFFIVAATVFCFENILFKNQIGSCKSELIAFLILCLIAVMFIVMTFMQPRIPLFQDMPTSNYGI